MPGEPVFELFFLRKYAGDGNNLHITHSSLEPLHLLLLQKQKTARKTATRDC